MAYKTFKYDDKVKLSEHFYSYNFRCKCSSKHDFKINLELVDLLERLMKRIEAVSFKILSGTRCKKHDKKVGGSGKTSASHVRGDAVDIRFYDKNKKAIPSKTVCLALEDMGHNYGIGYRGGGTSNSNGETHIDVKKRKWYGDESKSFSKAVCKSFYEYFGIPKHIYLKLGTYTLKSIRNVYDGPSNKTRRKLVKDLTTDGRKHATSLKLNDKASLKAGTKVSVKKVITNEEGHVWGKIPSGWICLISNNGTKHYK